MMFVCIVGPDVWGGSSSMESLLRLANLSGASDEGCRISCRFSLVSSLGFTPIMLETALLSERCKVGRLELFCSFGIGTHFLLDLQTSRPESLQCRRREKWRSLRSRMRR